MRKPREAVSVRVDVETYKYLQLWGIAHKSSLIETVNRLVNLQEDRYPLTFQIVRKVLDDEDTMFDVVVNDVNVRNAVCWQPTVELALRELAAFRKKWGFDNKRFPLSDDLVDEDCRDIIAIEGVA